MRVAFIGFGEVGYHFARRLSTRGVELTAYRRQRELAEAHAGETGVRLCASLGEALTEADVVFSCVWPQTALEVAEQAAAFLRPGQLFGDLNNTSPGTAQRTCDAVAPSGAAFAKIGLMGPPYDRGGKTPMLLGGPGAQRLAALMQSWDMDARCMGDNPRAPATFKIVRAFGLKATTAAAYEMLRLARRHGLDEEELLASAGQTLGWEGYGKHMGASIAGNAVHAGRRAQEMDEVAETIAEVGLDPEFARAVQHVYAGLAASGAREVFGETRPTDYRQVLDVVEAKAAARATSASGGAAAGR